MSRLNDSILSNIKEDELLEASYSRIYQHIQDDSTFAIIGSEDKDTGEDRYNELVNLLRKVSVKAKHHIGFNKIDGTYKYQNGPSKGDIGFEDSLIIYNIPKEKALEMGRKINQESIVWKDKDFFGIIYCSDGSTMMEFSGKTMNFSKATEKDTEFGSKLKNDKSKGLGMIFEATIYVATSGGMMSHIETKPVPFRITFTEE